MSEYVQRKAIGKRKICRPFDAVCLEGGCGYCHLGGWVTIKGLRGIVKRLNDPVLTKALDEGLKHDFYNAPVEYFDGTKRY